MSIRSAAAPRGATGWAARLARAEEEEEEEEVVQKPAKAVAKAAPKAAPAPAKSSAAKSSGSDPAEYEAGKLALAKFEDDGKFYTVQLVKDNGDGTWDIKWCEDEAEDQVKIADMKPQRKEFQPGDVVVAKCNDGNRYTAEVKSNAGAGWVDVEWMQDGGEETVALDDCWTQKKSFKVGQAVEAKFPDDGEFYGAKVIKDLGKCKYEVTWDEDDDNNGPSELWIDDMRVPRVDMTTYEIGQQLTGTIKSVREFGAFVDVGSYTDGLIHVSKMANARVSDPSKYVQEEQEVTVWVCSIDKEANRLGLTLIQSKAGGGGGKGRGKGR